jgi:D-3-phosphoglycerate dehydrogenase
MRYGTGYDNIDVAAATEAGIAVGINADYCVDEVATHALTLILACHRQLAALTYTVRNGGWDPMKVLRPTPSLRSQTVGVLGFGRIGRRVIDLIQPLAGKVLVHDPFVETAAQPAGSFEWASFDRLLAESDYISIHAPLNSNTHHLFNRDTLSRLKPGCYLINCARGALIDESALMEALERGSLAGAALDVFEREPLPAGHSLRDHPNVIVTPHAAWYSTDADYRLRANPAEAIVKFFRGIPIDLLNRPRTQDGQ